MVFFVIYRYTRFSGPEMIGQRIPYDCKYPCAETGFIGIVSGDIPGNLEKNIADDVFCLLFIQQTIKNVVVHFTEIFIIHSLQKTCLRKLPHIYPPSIRSISKVYDACEVVSRAVIPKKEHIQGCCNERRLSFFYIFLYCTKIHHEMQNIFVSLILRLNLMEMTGWNSLEQTIF